MDDKVSEWKGHFVFGDVSELNGIISSDGHIPLYESDIINTLDHGGDSYIVTGIGNTVKDAVELAISNIPCHARLINALLIAFWCGTKEISTADINSLHEILKRFHCDTKWGIFHDAALGDSYKVTIIATTPIELSKWRKFFSDIRKERRAEMLKRHAYLSDIVKEYTRLEDFAREKREFFEMMGVEMNSGDKNVSLYFQLDYNEYEEYFVVPTVDGRLAVSHVIWWQNEKCANEILNIFTGDTYDDDDVIFTNY